MVARILTLHPCTYQNYRRMPEPIRINDSLTVAVEELEFQAIRAQGPGGQNVNKVATAIQLRFDAANSPSLPEAIRRRLLALSDSRIGDDGVVLIKAQTHRSQQRNREDAVDRLVRMIAAAAEKPKVRKKTRPSAAAKKKRLDNKRRRADLKTGRRSPTDY